MLLHVILLPIEKEKRVKLLQRLEKCFSVRTFFSLCLLMFMCRGSQIELCSPLFYSYFPLMCARHYIYNVCPEALFVLMLLTFKHPSFITLPCRCSTIRQSQEHKQIVPIRLNPLSHSSPSLVSLLLAVTLIHRRERQPLTVPTRPLRVRCIVPR